MSWEPAKRAKMRVDARAVHKRQEPSFVSASDNDSETQSVASSAGAQGAAELVQTVKRLEADFVAFRWQVESQLNEMQHVVTQLLARDHHRRADSSSSLLSDNNGTHIPRAYALAPAPMTPPARHPMEMHLTRGPPPQQQGHAAAPAAAVVAQPPAVSLSAEHEDPVGPWLRLDGVTKKWYTKRPYPTFRVQVVNPERVAMCVDTRSMPHNEALSVQLRLWSGEEEYRDQHLHSTDHNHTYPIDLSTGVATISGLRFNAVTSRNGGYFMLEVQAPGTNIASIRSDKILVLSERLKNEGKAASIFELSSGDNLARVPGIGKKYAARLAECHFHTIRDLGSISSADNDDGRKNRHKLLSEIRRDRGALTEAKLIDLLRDAQAVVRRDQEAGHHHPHPHPQPQQNAQEDTPTSYSPAASPHTSPTLNPTPTPTPTPTPSTTPMDPAAATAAAAATSPTLHPHNSALHPHNNNNNQHNHATMLNVDPLGHGVLSRPALVHTAAGGGGGGEGRGGGASPRANKRLRADNAPLTRTPPTSSHLLTALTPSRSPANIAAIAIQPHPTSSLTLDPSSSLTPDPSRSLLNTLHPPPTAYTNSLPLTPTPGPATPGGAIVVCGPSPAPKEAGKAAPAVLAAVVPAKLDEVDLMLNLNTTGEGQSASFEDLNNDFDLASAC